MVDPPPKKINLISCEPLAHISDIKLIKTNTTLDLSQKVEKVMPNNIAYHAFYFSYVLRYFVSYAIWDSYALKS